MASSGFSGLLQLNGVITRNAALHFRSFLLPGAILLILVTFWCLHGVARAMFFRRFSEGLGHHHTSGTSEQHCCVPRFRHWKPREKNAVGFDIGKTEVTLAIVKSCCQSTCVPVTINSKNQRRNPGYQICTLTVNRRRHGQPRKIRSTCPLRRTTAMFYAWDENN